MKRAAARLLVLCVAPLLAAGCAQIDPYQRPGMWQPDDAIDRNIAAMAQDPGDVVHGRGAAGPSLKTGATAVDALWRDKVKPLPDNSAIGTTATGPPQGGTP